MQEIKAITRHTHTKETAPTQPKTRDNFTNLLDELIGTGGNDLNPAAKTAIPPNGQDTLAKSAKPGDGKLVPAPVDSKQPLLQSGDSTDPSLLPADAVASTPDQVRLEGTDCHAIAMAKAQKPSDSGKTSLADTTAPISTNPIVPLDLTGLANVKPFPAAPKVVETPNDPAKVVASSTNPTGLDVDPQPQPQSPAPAIIGTPAEFVLKTAGPDKSDKLEKHITAIVPGRGEDVSRFPLQFMGPAMAVQPHHTVSVNTGIVPPPTNPETADPATISDADQQTSERLTLGDFGVTRFEFKNEIEPRPFTLLQSTQMMQMMRTSAPGREIKAVKLAGSDSDSTSREGSTPFAPMAPPAAIAAPEAAEHVRLVFEPPAPPPVVRSVSMDIGDPESQVRVVIRERNGSLNVQFAAGSEHLRQDLQSSGSLLMRELQRNNPSAVTLDFTNFGSATESDSQSRSQSEAKKQLKSDADFADAVESAYLPASSSTLKSL